MKKVFGVLFILAGIGLGLYFGLWVLFIGGIFGIAKAIDTHTVTAMLIGINVIKIFFAGFVGWLTFWVCTLIGGVLLSLK